MKLAVVSHKRVWPNEGKPGYFTVGGFPFQIEVLSTLFEQITLVVALSDLPAPIDGQSMCNHQTAVRALPEPKGKSLWRKINLITWLPRNFHIIWQEVSKADAVHTPVPGDIGTIGLLVALAQGKPLFVRHCGTWGNRTTLADRFLDWLLPRIAGGKNVVLATGGGEERPSTKNPEVKWIFSTSLSEKEMSEIPIAQPWEPGQPLRLVTVGRITKGKNAEAILHALAILENESGMPKKSSAEDAACNSIPPMGELTLDIVGDGENRLELEKLAKELGIAKRVKFHGNVSHDHVLNILAKANIFVFPTRVKEGFPKAVLEAMACGLPIVASDVSVIPQLIQDCGVVLPDTGSKAIAEAVQRLVEKPERMRVYAQKAWENAQKYTLERWRDEIGEHLEAAWGSLTHSIQKN